MNVSRALVVSFAAFALALLPALLGDLSAAQAAPAATITVNDLSDTSSPGPGVCTFRSALHAANTNHAVAGCAAGSPSGSDLIVVPAGTLTITQYAGLDITSTLTISGAGESQTIFTSPNVVRVLYITGTVRVNVQGISVRNLNYSTAGSGIFIPSAASIVTVTHSSFISNTASPGAIWNGGTLFIDHVTFKGNHSDGAGGGAFYNNYGARLTLQNSTLSDNSASNDGGGILDGGYLTITNSTISTNNAGRDGGGIMVYSGTVNLQSSTIANNFVYDSIFDPATTGSGGVDVYSGAIFAFHQSVIAGNYYSPLFGSLSSDDCFGTLTSQHYNWIGTIPLNCTVSAFNLTDHTGNPQLGPLRDNGGPTRTHAPGLGSGLVDTGDPACALATDQRGVHRPIDGNRNGIAICDIGAVEFQLPLFLPVVTR